MDKTKRKKIVALMEAVMKSANQRARDMNLLEPHEIIKNDFFIDHVPVPTKIDEKILELPVAHFFTEERVGSAGVNVSFFAYNIQRVMLRHERELGRKLYVKDLKTLDFDSLKKVYMAGAKTIQAIKVVLLHYQII